MQNLIYGQNIALEIKFKKDNPKIRNTIHFNKYHKSTKSIYKEIDSILSQLETKGYLNATIDNIQKNDTLYIAQYKLGKSIKNIRIFYNKNQIPEKEIKKFSKTHTDTFFEIPFHKTKYTLSEIIAFIESSGASFTQVSLSKIKLENNLAIAELKIKNTKPRTIDKIIVKGYENFPKSYIKHELHLKIGSVFNKKKMEFTSNAINKIIFAEEQKPPEILFTNDSTYIYLYLKKKQSNQFDGVLGFNSKEEEDQSGIDFNGYLDFSFNNIFNKGENIALFWKNNGNDSQRFYIGATIPYIFNSPISPEVNFEIYRQDSTYSTITTNIHLEYNLNKKGRISASYNTEKSSNLTKTNNPNIQTFNNRFYGVTYQYNLLTNDVLFPIQFNLNTSTYLGSRTSEQENTDQTKLKIETHYQWYIDNKNYIFLKNKSAILNSSNYLENELFRIGGTNDLRGVNEESIFTTAFSIFNLEYRFRPSLSSYFFTITDYAFIENKIIEESNKIYSLGLGYAFFTKVGLLNISYAIGKFENTPFDFNNSKLHIKIISIF